MQFKMQTFACTVTNRTFLATDLHIWTRELVKAAQKRAVPCNCKALPLNSLSKDYTIE